MSVEHLGFEAVIGLEIHAQLSTQSKLFCRCPASFGAEANINTCPVCVGHPGALPVLNSEAVDMAILAGLALNCQINKTSVFARKNYFYPDLPKGYQISQFDQPICGEGYIDIEYTSSSGESETLLQKRISIERIHIEEDAGQSQHVTGATLVNLNRAATPLIEIVSKPNMFSAQEAGAYMRAVRNILMYVGVNDGNLQEGNLRCDANVSVRKTGDTKLGTRAEIKNVNSFRFLEKAVEYEILRQVQVVVSGSRVVQETRGYDAAKNVTYSMRSKEDAHDYRYFPEPDLHPLRVTEERISKVAKRLVELPAEKYTRYVNDMKIAPAAARTITSLKLIADYFEEVVSLCANQKTDAKTVANWVSGEVLRVMGTSVQEPGDSTEDTAEGSTDSTTKTHSIIPVKASSLAGLINLVSAGVINNNTAKAVFEEMLSSGQEAQTIVQAKGLAQVSDEGAIGASIDKVLAGCASQVAEYKSGKEKVYGFLVGQVMRELKGKGNPSLINDILRKKSLTKTRN